MVVRAFAGKPFLFALPFKPMKITSLAFWDNLPVPTQYTCNGVNTSPPFEFLDVPEETKSLTLIVEDLDSAAQSIHWLVYNIPGDVTHFDEGVVPEGAVCGMCNDGKRSYNGPCPKYYKGLHRYAFTLFALDCMLNVPSDATCTSIKAAMEDHILDSDVLIGLAEGEIAD
jgi:Raf kinase inhibitor-like YbhB/YbcL family protein